MPTRRIDDPADPELRPFAALTSRRPTDGTVVVEGEIAVARALASDHPVEALLLTPRHRARLGARLPAEMPVFEAEAAVVRAVVGFDFHRGCVAVMPRPRPPSLEAIAAGLGEGPAVVVVAEALADPANLGALVRNARAFGAAAVLHGGGADPWSRRAIRAAMGLGFTLPLVRCDDLAGAVDRLRAGMSAQARTVAAVVQPGAIPLPQHRPAVQSILLVGNEGAGLSASLRSRADDAVMIPLAPGVDSLNVAAATAVLLWTLAARGGPVSEP